MATLILTAWHKENPNDWLAIKRWTARKPVLLGRDKSLVTLHMQMGGKKVTYAKAWSLGISKDYPIQNG